MIRWGAAVWGVVVLAAVVVVALVLVGYQRLFTVIVESFVALMRLLGL